jgi:DNA/RNA-binding domain of Phe-tRNA-synthetase-like protein
VIRPGIDDRFISLEVDMLMLSATGEWQKAHPGAAIGVLEVSGVDNTRPAASLENRKRETEERLRVSFGGFSRQDFLMHPVMSAYEKYYKRFDKTYHVLLQAESIVHKGKNLPTVSPLVDANFAAEVETWILTAGHDVELLQEPVFFDVTRPGDVMVQMNGAAKDLRAGDMAMKDTGGVCCTILYGQDNRSPISARTSHVLYVAYAPAGVPAELVETQLRRIEENIRLFSPAAVKEQRRLLRAGEGSSA